VAHRVISRRCGIWSLSGHSGLWRVISRGPGAPKKFDRAWQALDHENRKTPISKPAANAQRPNVQAETTRARLRRSLSCGISSDRSVIATAPPFAAIAGAALYGRAASRRPGNTFSINPNSGPVCPACNIGVALFAGLFCICEWLFRPAPQKARLPAEHFRLSVVLD
jgi:hypothetical protein